MNSNAFNNGFSVCLIFKEIYNFFNGHSKVGGLGVKIALGL